MTTSTSGRALVVAHELDGPGRQVSIRLAERGYEIYDHVVTADMEKPNEASAFPDFADFDIIVLMGSIRSLTNKEEISSWVHTELEMIAAAHANNQPILGVCFGGQLIADALGGSVELGPVTELGWFEVEPTPGADCPIGPGPWMQWHHDRFNPPAAASVLAQNENAAQLFRIGRTVGTQFHPEVDVAHLEGWLQLADDDYLAEHGTSAARIMAEVIEHEARNIAQCHNFVDWFVDSVVAQPSTSELSDS